MSPAILTNHSEPPRFLTCCAGRGVFVVHFRKCFPRLQPVAAKRDRATGGGIIFPNFSSEIFSYPLCPTAIDISLENFGKFIPPPVTIPRLAATDWRRAKHFLKHTTNTPRPAQQAKNRRCLF